MHSLLFVPASPSAATNGLVIRSRLWRDALRSLGTVDVAVAALAGWSAGGDELPVELGQAPPGVAGRALDTELCGAVGLPTASRNATPEAGAAWAERHRDRIERAEVVVVLRSYLAPFALGVLEAIGPRPLVVDVDDDEVAMAERSGRARDALAFRMLNRALRRRGVTLAGAQPYPGVRFVPNSFPPVERPLPVPTDPPTVLFVGNLSYRPNVDGLRWLVEEVMPAVRTPVRFIVAGPGSDRLPWLPARYEALGYVDDLAPWYAQASVAVAPLLLGSGTRIKILEAWASNVPVVSTSVGVDGLGGEHGKELLIADDPAVFAASIDTVLRSPELGRQLAAAAAAQFAEHHSWERAIETASKVVGEARCAPASVPAMASRAPAGLQVTEVDDGLVIYLRDRHRVHHLNAAATLLFDLCDGSRSEREICALVEPLGEPFTVERVRATLAELRSEGLTSRSG